MTRLEEQRTREYRAGLCKALSVAKLRLSEADFARMSAGIIAEIRRIDESLSRSGLEHYMGLNAGLLPGWGFVGIVERNTMMVRRCSDLLFNSAFTSSPWASDVTTKINTKPKRTITGSSQSLAMQAI